MKQLRDKPSVVLTVYLTANGYQKIGIPDNLIPEENGFKHSFYESVLLDKSKVKKEYQQHDFDAIILFAYDDLPEEITELSGFQGLFWNYGIQVYHLPDLTDCCKTIVFEKGILENPMKKPYRFKENIANPKFFPGALASQIRNYKTDALQAVSAEGLPPLGLVLKHDKAGNTGFSCGSYGAFAKFEMHEDAFDALVEDLEVKAGLNTEQALAYLMGRFPDGTPLTLSENALDLPTDHFDYKELIKVKQGNHPEEDMGGRCPFHAHIRKANPRTEESKDKKIVRQGTFFKERNEKGLLFMSFQASIEKQFLFILNNWMLNKVTNQVDDNGLLTLNSGKDILFAKAEEMYPLPDDWNGLKKEKQAHKITIPKDLVSFRGGVYFFAPSVSFFQRIALFGEIAKAKANHLAKINRQNVAAYDNEVRGQEINFLSNTVIRLGNKKLKNKSNAGVEWLENSQIVLAPSSVL
jgi:hypothetical protein